MTRIAFVCLMVALKAELAVGAGALPAEILSETVLSQYAALPTCATHGGEPLVSDRAAGKSDLIVGYDDGAIVIFQFDSLNLNTPAFTVRLPGGRPVDDICGIRPLSHRSARQDAFVIALQGRDLTLVSTESIRALDTRALPATSDGYRLAVIDASQRTFVHDGESIFEIRDVPDADGWSLDMRRISGPGRLTSVITLSDRLLLVGETDVTEISGAGTETLPIDMEAPGAPDSLVCSCGSSDWIAFAYASGESGRASVYRRMGDEWSPWSTTGLPGVPSAAAAYDDTTAAFAGGLTSAAGDAIGWIALVDISGNVRARSDHPVPVAYLAVLDDWVVAHGKRSNLSVYTRSLDPIWDHASMVIPVALLVQNFDGLGYEDVAVVGAEEQGRKRAEIDSMRVLLDRPDLFADAEIIGANPDGSGGIYYRLASRAVLFLNNRERFESVLAIESVRARAALAEGRSDEARPAAMEARAAAAALGLRSEVREQTSVLVESRYLPVRRRRMYIWSAALLAAGIWISALYLRDRTDRAGVGMASAGALLIAAIVGYVLRRPPQFGLLFLGGAVPLVALAVTAGRRSLQYAALAPGAPIEELSRGIMGFRHGGQGDFSPELGGKVSDDARKNITQLAYLAREMMDARDVPERFDAMKRVLAKSAATFRESVMPEISHLAALGRSIGFMVERLNRMEAASASIDRALTSILAETPPGESEFAERLREIKDSRQALVDSAEAVCEAVVANPGCSLNSVLDDLMDLRSDFLSKHSVGVRFESDVDRETDAVRGSRYVLFTVFENVVTNAVMAMKQTNERSLGITAQEDGAACVVVVTDNGRGMSDEELGRVFEEKNGSEEGGFGLPYSRRVLRRLGGNMSIVSEPGVGTEVTVSIPRWSAVCDGDDNG